LRASRACPKLRGQANPPFTAPLYAVLEGLFLGAISAYYEAAFGSQGGNAGPFSGIVVQAVALAVLAVLQLRYAA